MTETLCDLMYTMRDRINEGKLEAALYLSSKIQNKLLELLKHKEPIKCTLDCTKGD